MLAEGLAKVACRPDLSLLVLSNLHTKNVLRITCSCKSDTCPANCWAGCISYLSGLTLDCTHLQIVRVM